VKLLFDENLSPHLPKLISDLYPGSAHVHDCSLGSADDIVIWLYAKDNGFVIVSKDSDFQERSILLGYPPKVILLRVTNCTSAEIEALLRAALSSITRFLEAGQESCLILTRAGAQKSS
jgi:predicted nuclease of predicted toxin-antitoxin system